MKTVRAHAVFVNYLRRHCIARRKCISRGRQRQRQKIATTTSTTAAATLTATTQTATATFHGTLYFVLLIIILHAGAETQTKRGWGEAERERGMKKTGGRQRGEQRQAGVQHRQTLACIISFTWSCCPKCFYLYLPVSLSLSAPLPLTLSDPTLSTVAANRSHSCPGKRRPCWRKSNMPTARASKRERESSLLPQRYHNFHLLLLLLFPVNIVVHTHTHTHIHI